MEVQSFMPARGGRGLGAASSRRHRQDRARSALRRPPVARAETGGL